MIYFIFLFSFLTTATFSATYTDVPLSPTKTSSATVPFLLSPIATSWDRAIHTLNYPIRRSCWESLQLVRATPKEEYGVLDINIKKVPGFEALGAPTSRPQTLNLVELANMLVDFLPVGTEVSPRYPESTLRSFIRQYPHITLFRFSKLACELNVTLELRSTLFLNGIRLEILNP